jgi:hypothetical protein
MAKDQKALELTGHHDRPCLDILLDGGPLCIATVWNWDENRARHDLFHVYHKKVGIQIGPYYTSITLAAEGMKKAIKLGKHIWENDAHWLSQQKWLHKWIDEQLGKPDDLIGGSWAPDTEA